VLVRIIALMLVVTTGSAAARSGEPIVLVSADAAFASALDDALVPAGMEVLAIGIVTAPPSAELAARSRELADHEQATATVWLLPGPAGATLVAYDRRVDRLLLRDLPYPLPLSPTQAAQAARMVRTMLRALRVASEEDLPPPPPLTPAAPEPMFAASVGAGVWFAAPGTDNALAATAMIAWRPHGLGVAITGLVAPSAAVMSLTFSGHVRDVVVAAEARKALRFAPDIYLTPAAGMALHVLGLSGSFGGAELDSRRFDPALRLGATASYALPRGVDVGLDVSADCLLRRQRYEAASEEILVVPRFQVVTGIVVGLRL
jgi:hypothetical protein